MGVINWKSERLIRAITLMEVQDMTRIPSSHICKLEQNKLKMKPKLHILKETYEKIPVYGEKGDTIITIEQFKYLSNNFNLTEYISTSTIEKIIKINKDLRFSTRPNVVKKLIEFVKEPHLQKIEDIESNINKPNLLQKIEDINNPNLLKYLIYGVNSKILTKEQAWDLYTKDYTS